MNDKSSPGIVAWIQGFGQRYQADRAQEQIVRQAIEMIVEIADPSIRQVGRYRKSSAVTGSWSNGVLHFPDRLHTWVRLGRQQYHADPLVKAIFTSADELEATLQNCLSARSLRYAQNFTLRIFGLR